MPRSQQLVLGWLMVCQPAEQSQAEIREAMGLSTGGVSNALRALAEFSLVERVGAAGDRTARYVLPPGAWARALDHGLEVMEQSLGLLRDAQRSLKRSGDARVAGNVGEFVAYYQRLAEIMRDVAASVRVGP
jgi:DNA-binding transcriptional regulator GbsR (MarR family)